MGEETQTYARLIYFKSISLKAMCSVHFRAQEPVHREQHGGRERHRDRQRPHLGQGLVPHPLRAQLHRQQAQVYI